MSFELIHLGRVIELINTDTLSVKFIEYVILVHFFMLHCSSL